MKGYSSALVCGVVFIAMAAPCEPGGQRDEIDRRSFAAAMSGLTAGDLLTVKETSGARWQGEFHSVEFVPARLILNDVVAKPVTHGATRHESIEISESSIEYVALETTKFRARGVLIGAGVGVGVAALAAQGCCGNPAYGPQTMFMVLAPIFGGAGALVGYLVDQGGTESEVIYTIEPPMSTFRWHVAPLVTRDHKGALLSLSF